eukprot:6752760-Pyramimonas_sp.AAC.1
MGPLQCGSGGTADILSPAPVVGLAGLDCRQVAAGMSHSAAVTAGGDLYTWGWNVAGQLGTNGSSVEVVPQLVADAPLDGTVTGVSCGSRHTAATTADGAVWAWGWNKYGQLGVTNIQCHESSYVMNKEAMPRERSRRAGPNLSYRQRGGHSNERA